MKYNGLKLIEMIPEKWDGNRKFMLVWRFNNDTMPQQREVVEWYKNEHGYVIWRDVYNDYWPHCAEIPTEEKEDVMKLLIDNENELLALREENAKLKAKVKALNSSNYQTHCGMHNVIAKLEDKIADLKEALKEKNKSDDETDEYVINSREEYDAAIAKIKAHFDEEDKCGEYDIASSVEEEKQYHKASLAYIKYLEEKNNKEDQIAWLNNEISNLQYELSQPCVNYDYKEKQLAMYKSFLELIYETK